MGLRFALLMTAAEPLLAAVDGLPQPLDYRICADLLDRRLGADEELAEARRRSSALLSEADLELASARHAELFTAAADPRDHERPLTSSIRSQPRVLGVAGRRERPTSRYGVDDSLTTSLSSHARR